MMTNIDKARKGRRAKPKTLPVQWHCPPEMIDAAFNESWWNLGQFVLWIGQRNKEAVAHASDQNLPGGPRHGGILVAAVWFETNGVTTETRSHWYGEAMRLLQTGRIRTSAIPQGETRPRPIPDYEFPQLEITHCLDGIPGLRWAKNHGVIPAYENVRVSRADVLRELPIIVASEPSNDPRRAGTAAAETRCRAWLVGEMSLNEKPLKPKAEYKSEAQQRFRVGTHGFRRSWSDAISQTGRDQWTRPGPRKRKS
jgi:hypothetical protein